MIVSLSDNTAVLERLGNKGRSLCEMKAAGFRVPDGFILDSDVYDSFVRENQLEECIGRALERLHTADIQVLASELSSAIAKAAMPSDIHKQIDAHSSSQCRYAVRSSSLLEDLDDTSFAGQYESFLDVPASELCEYVIACYQSLFSESALSYLRDTRVDVHELKMAVVIQEMVSAQLSGICFTAHPLSGNDREMLIELSKGRGDKLVGGQTEPERYVYNWYEQKLVEGGTQGSLTSEQLKCYGDKLFELQLLFGYPLDIEFAIDDVGLHLLQARPITRFAYSEIEDIWSTADFKDGGVSATVCTPYMWSLYEYIWEASLRDFIVGSHILRTDELPAKLGEMFFGRGYWNMTAVKKAMSRIIGYREREFDNEYGIVGDYEGDGQTTPLNPRSLMRMAFIAKEQLRLVRDRKRNNEHYKQELLALYEEYKQRYDEGCIEDIEAAFVRLTREVYFQSETNYFSQIFLNTVHQSIYKDSLLKYLSEAEYLSLLGSIDDISHLRPFYDMWELSRQIRADKASAAFWQEHTAEELAGQLSITAHGMPELRALIERYGYHSDKELDVSYPCYYEDPTTIIKTLREMLAQDDSYSPGADKERGSAAYKSVREKLRRQLSSHQFKRLSRRIDDMRAMLWWREEFRDVSTRFYYLIRVYTMAYAQQLVCEGALEQLEDVWFLKVGDLWDYADARFSAVELRNKIYKNRRYYQAFRNYTSDNEIGSRLRPAPSSQTRAQDELLVGLGASAGCVHGRARVIYDFADIDRLQSGDVLVTRFTDTGWTPKFAILSGIVTEYGGILCHAAIVAREYGIPAIVCCKDAMSAIDDGQMIVIDGATGEVRLDL